MIWWCLILVGVLLLGVAISRAVPPDADDEEQFAEVLLASLENILNWSREVCECPSCQDHATTPGSGAFYVDGEETRAHMTLDCQGCGYQHHMSVDINQYAMLAAYTHFERATTCDAMFDMESFDEIIASYDEEEDVEA